MSKKLRLITFLNLSFTEHKEMFDVKLIIKARVKKQIIKSVKPLKTSKFLVH